MLVPSRGENRSVLMRREMSALPAVGGCKIHLNGSIGGGGPDDRQGPEEIVRSDSEVPSNRDRLPEPEDQDIRRRIENFLWGRHVYALRRVRVTVRDREVTIKGSVRTYHEKQVATACCQRVAGVLYVRNELEVSKAERTNSEEE